VDADDRRFSSGMIGVRDFCNDGNQSLSSYVNLVVNESDQNRSGNLIKPARK
jgi:hypothetical protein